MLCDKGYGYLFFGLGEGVRTTPLNGIISPWHVRVVVNIPATWKQTRCFFNMAERHHTSAPRWHVLESDNCPRDGSAEGFHFLSSAILRSDTSRQSVRLCEGWGLPSTKACNPEKDRIRTSSAKTEYPLVQNVWHEVGYRLDVGKATNWKHTELA